VKWGAGGVLDDQGAACGGGGGGTLTHYINFDQCSAGETTNPGKAFWTVLALTAWDAGHWEFTKNTNADIFCSVRIPNTVAETPDAHVVIDLAANDATAGHTAAFKTCDNITTTLNLQVGALTCEATQNYTSTATAYANTELTFDINAAVVANQILVVNINQATGGANTANVIMPKPMLKIDLTQ